MRILKPNLWQILTVLAVPAFLFCLGFFESQSSQSDTHESSNSNSHVYVNSLRAGGVLFEDSKPQVDFNISEQGKLADISPKQQMALGAELHNQFIETGFFKIHESKELNDYIASIGSQIVPHLRTKIEEFKRPTYFKFFIVEDNEINASATLGGYTYYTTGMLAFLESEAELAGVIGHELGHLIGNHFLKGMAKEAKHEEFLLKTWTFDNRLVSGFSNYLRSNDRKSKEYEADETGFLALKSSPYDSRQMLAFFSRLLDTFGSTKPSLFASHPNTRKRIQNLRGRQLLFFPQNQGVTNDRIYRLKVCKHIKC